MRLDGPRGKPHTGRNEPLLVCESAAGQEVDGPYPCLRQAQAPRCVGYPRLRLAQCQRPGLRAVETGVSSTGIWPQLEEKQSAKPIRDRLGILCIGKTNLFSKRGVFVATSRGKFELSEHAKQDVQ